MGMVAVGMFEVVVGLVGGGRRVKCGCELKQPSGSSKYLVFGVKTIIRAQFLQCEESDEQKTDGSRINPPVPRACFERVWASKRISVVLGRRWMNPVHGS